MAIGTELTSDGLEGAVAGGINGIFLAKTLASEGDLKQLDNLWFYEGDVEELLNDSASYKGLRIAPQSAPKSLLNGRRMYVKLLDALDEMERGAD